MIKSTVVTVDLKRVVYCENVLHCAVISLVHGVAQCQTNNVTLLH